MAPKKNSTLKHVIVTTERRGVFYGALKSYNEKARVAILENAAMAIYWGTTNGLLELAATGPTSKSKISNKACHRQITTEADHGE